MHPSRKEERKKERKKEMCFKVKEVIYIYASINK